MRLFIACLMSAFSLLPHGAMSISPSELVKTTQEFEKKYLRKFRSLECYDKTKHYRVAITLHLYLSNETKEVFTNQNLIANLQYVLRPGPWLRYLIYTNDACFDIVAWGDSHLKVLMCNYNDSGKDLVKFVHRNELECFFVIEQIASAYFGLKDGIIYVIPRQIKNTEYKMIPLDSYIPEYWDDLYEGSFNPMTKNGSRSD